jgi:hypothetical protein
MVLVLTTRNPTDRPIMRISIHFCNKQCGILKFQKEKENSMLLSLDGMCSFLAIGVDFELM